ncbi:MAG: holo-ACP synthase [Eubacteriales bacterium]|jgi:phosphopantetheine--protein transferase-like protein
MIFGIGIDLIAVSRISVLKKTEDPFFSSVFTLKEREQAASQADPMAYYAGRFSAKEAVYKSLRMPGDARFSEIEVISNPFGAPEVHLSGTLLEYAKKHNIKRIHISISHETDYAISYAIAETEEFE